MCSRPITSLLILSPLFLYAKALTTPSSFIRHERRTCFITTSTAKTTTSNQHNIRSCPKEPTTILFAGTDSTNTENEKAKAALLRTSKHLQKLNQKAAFAAPVVATVDKTQEELDDALLQSYMDQTVNALKEELASRGLAKSGVKSDLALRLMQYDMEQQLTQNLPVDNDDITSETSSNEAEAEESEELQEERKNIYQSYIVQPSNSLKVLLKSKRLKKTGRKPDLAKRLTDHDMELKYPHLRVTQTDFKDDVETDPKKVREDEMARAKRREEMEAREPFIEFAGIEGLSYAAGKALAMAGFEAPSGIQSAVIPMASMGESVIMHAETGSGKTLAYLLPITEQLWKDERLDNTNSKVGIILTPTRELAAQVAGVASVLSPPNSVKLISTPTNLLSKNNAEDGINGGKVEKGGGNVRLIVGSAKAIMVSLYGDGKMPAPPTPKPLAKHFLSNVGWMVMDEVDRLLDVKKGRITKKRKHEKPAAIVAAAVARLTLGNFQTIAASATVGRPLRRELARVLGLPSKECPQVVREDESTTSSSTANDDKHIGRAVTIPMGVNNFVFPCDGGTSGSLLTSAAFVAKALPPKKDGTPRRVLLVLSKGSGLTVHNTVGALGHFGVTPKPVALLDALEVDGTPDRLIAVHREVSGSSFGVDASESNEGYVLVTSEDNIRGLHLDGLDTVIVVGRPEGPDEYSHVAGRTGRAGQEGNVINVVSFEQAAALTSWEKMLMVDFVPLEMSQISKLN